MTIFAKVQNGIVVDVVVADEEIMYSGKVFVDGMWVQTSENTRGGVHYGNDGLPDGGVALRKNYAGVGYAYDEQLDAFIPPRPFASWVLDKGSCIYVPPIPKPDIGDYQWSEESKSWIEKF